jgi:hypothetical protein
MDDATRRHLKYYAIRSKLYKRNIEIVRRVLEGMDYQEAGAEYHFSKNHVKHIVEYLVKDAARYAEWLGQSSPWTRDKCPNAYYRNVIVERVYFVPRALTVQQLRAEKEYLMDLLTKLQGAMEEYHALFKTG